jgi:Adenylate and Guanylate cyclase catalytic domain
LFYPIIDKIDKVYVAGADDYNAADHRIVGMMTASIYWRTLLRDALPPDSNGVQAVFKNKCTNSFTYQVNGPDVKYIGVGDHHDEQYDKLGTAVSFLDLGAFAIRDSLYSGAHLYSEYCPFSLHLYPSDVMKSAFVTNHPLVFSLVAFFIFLFTSLLFVLYDRGVERRQRMVMTTAERSSAIVSSLFPSTVRDRLYAIPENGRGPSMPPESAKGKLHRFLREDTASSKPSGVEGTPAGSPIAELYPDTTVLFADIAGFTSWSSVRTPTQVFHLLEAVYGAFDAIANKRGVFKVETIGDSYVAVVGLPTPRKHHAVVMARFARDCCDKMRELVLELEKLLGPVSCTLAMTRVVHCGKTSSSNVYACSFSPGNGRFSHAIWIEFGSNDWRCLTRRKGSISAVWRCKFARHRT